MGCIWRPQAGSPHLCRDCHCHACRTCASMTPSRAWAGLSSPRAVGSPGRGELSAVFQVTPQDSSKLAGPTEGVGLLCSPAGRGGGAAPWPPRGQPGPLTFLLPASSFSRAPPGGHALDGGGVSVMGQPWMPEAWGGPGGRLGGRYPHLRAPTPRGRLQTAGPGSFWPHAEHLHLQRCARQGLPPDFAIKRPHCVCF